MKPYLFILIVFSINACKSATDSDIVQEGAVVEKLADGFSFTEGPAVDKEGNVFFTDQPNDRIMRWSTDDELSTWMQPSGRSNGLCFDGQGNLWSCADEKNELWVISPGKEIKVLLDSYMGNKLNGPNDLWIAPNGNVYFSDPFYKRPWWDRDTTQQDGQHVYLLRADNGQLLRVIDDLVQPNGIIGTPDGKKLYVTDISDKKTYSYVILESGELGSKQLFCEMGSDGMTLDNRGNLYLTNSAGVTVFNEAGQQIKNIPIEQSWTANVCFGGPDMKSLFITARTGLYRLRMNVKGVGSQ